jgi:hypothetical protein
MGSKGWDRFNLTTGAAQTPEQSHPSNKQQYPNNSRQSGAANLGLINVLSRISLFIGLITYSGDAY